MKVQPALVRHAIRLSLGAALLLGSAVQAQSPVGQSQGAPMMMPGSGAGYWVPIRIYGWPSELLGMPAPPGMGGIPGLPLCRGTSSEDGTWVWIPKNTPGAGVMGGAPGPAEAPAGQPVD